MTEKAKRLTPRSETVRQLYLHSGNLCAFPKCGHLMMDEKGKFIGEICHIEAAEEGGQRFNKKMSNEDRRQGSNLMLMCRDHHKETDDEELYKVERLRQMKADHEKRFSNPVRTILETLKDWTDADVPTPTVTLSAMNSALKWNHSVAELKQSAPEVNEYASKLRRMPIALRRFVGKVAERIVKMKSTEVVSNDMGGVRILADDIAGAFDIDTTEVHHLARRLEQYSVGDLAEFDTDHGIEYAVRIRKLDSSWDLWSDLVNFCTNRNIAIEAFTDDLDFARLDD